MTAETLALVGDIGGTNARFALTHLSSPKVELLNSQTLANADFASMQHAIEHYLASIGARPAVAALAVACPVGQDEIRLTNRAWSFSRSELQRTLGLDELRMLNDFGAVARAIPALAREHLPTLHGDPAAPLRGPVSVLGPGTGLGVALLVGSDASGWHAVETEGGHASFAPVGEEERAIASWLTAQHGRTSTERLLCGKGLSEIDAVLRGASAVLPSQVPSPGSASLLRPTLRTPPRIVAAALEGHDAAARRTLARFCAVLGSVAGDCALVHGARTVVIAGGIVPRFIPFLRSSAFRERFLAKGRMAALLESVAIHVITHPHPGLLGAATALRSQGRTPPMIDSARHSREVDAVFALAPVIPVLTIADIDDALPLARALAGNGLPVLEITLRSACALEAIALIARDLPHACVGAGTVLTRQDLDAVARGRRPLRDFPGATDALYRDAAASAIPLIPGIATASELMRGIEHGWQRFKFFPAESSGGMAALRGFAGPFAQVRFCPTGGIDAAKAPAYLAQPNVACVGGSWMVPPDALKARDWQRIGELAREASALR